MTAFATQPLGLITGLLLIDIGESFGQPVGVAGQLTTATRVVGVVFALIIGVLSTRHSHKTLLVLGILALAVSALGSAYAPVFGVLILASAVGGVGASMINPMSQSIIGEKFTTGERANVVGWTWAGTSVAYLLCSPLVSFVAGEGGWRLAFLAVMLPLASLSLILSYVWVPDVRSKEGGGSISLFSGYRATVSNLSAATCLVGTLLASALWPASLTYTVSYFRESFQLSTYWASLLLSSLALSKTGGHMTSGYVINRYGRKRVTVYSILLLGVTTAGYLTLGSLWPAVAVANVACFIAGYMDSSVTAFNLEQVPDYRGSMMSLSNAVYLLGASIGTGVGGFILVTSSYAWLGVFFLAASMVSAAVYQVFTVDPLKQRGR
jgi:predicted MFS family arabinose efflux permease